MDANLAVRHGFACYHHGTTCASEEKSNKFILLEKKKDHIIFKIKPN
jgi:hypothetical protein